MIDVARASGFVCTYLPPAGYSKNKTRTINGADQVSNAGLAGFISNGVFMSAPVTIFL